MVDLNRNFVIRCGSSTPDIVNDLRDCPLRDFATLSVYQARKNTFTPAECVVLSEKILDSASDINRLSSAFQGSTGLQAVFRRDGVDELSRCLPMLTRFFDTAATPACNAFFINALIVRDAVEVKSHVDCSLNPFLPYHTVPKRVSVLYVKIPEDLTGGDLQLFGNGGKITQIKPSVGLLVQFQGDTPHAISEVRTKSERISVVLEEFQLPENVLELIPKFSLSPESSYYTAARAYQKVFDFIASLTPEEQAQLKLIAEDQFSGAELKSSE